MTKIETKRYALRVELTDSTLEEPYYYVARKADALKCARLAAKGRPFDAVRVWVDDTTTELGIAAFNVGTGTPHKWGV